jgi:hypothetical protein
MMMPAPSPSYAEAGVPADIAEDMQEAIRAHAFGLNTAAGVLGRRVIEMMTREKNAAGGNLKARIDDLCTKGVVPQNMKEHAHEIRAVGNDAAHETAKFSADDAADVLDFAREVLHHVYVAPHRLAESRKRRGVGGT